MDTRSDAAGDAVVLRWTGSIDFSTTSALEREVDAAVQGSPVHLVIDVSGTTFTDSSALGLLVHARNRCDENDVPLTVRGASAQLRTVLSVTGLDQVLDVAPG